MVKFRVYFEIRVHRICWQFGCGVCEKEGAQEWWQGYLHEQLEGNGVAMNWDEAQGCIQVELVWGMEADDKTGFGHGKFRMPDGHLDCSYKVGSH